MDFTEILFDAKDKHIQDLERQIKILKKRLHDSKQKNREEKLKLKYDLNKVLKDVQKQRDKTIDASHYRYDEDGFDGLIYFSSNIRQYILSGLKHMKSCSYCLDKTCPDDIKYLKDDNGEFVKRIESLGSDTYVWTGYEERPKEESRKEWGSILGKMIKALELKEKYFEKYFELGSPSEKEKEIIREGLELLIKYQDEFIY